MCVGGGGDKCMYISIYRRYVYTYMPMRVCICGGEFVRACDCGVCVCVEGGGMEKLTSTLVDLGLATRPIR